MEDDSDIYNQCVCQAGTDAFRGNLTCGLLPRDLGVGQGFLYHSRSDWVCRRPGQSPIVST